MSTSDPFGTRMPNAAWQPVAENPNPVRGQGSGGQVPPKKADPVIIFAIIGFLLLGLVAIAVAGYLLLALGPVAAAIAFVMAFVPLLVVLLAVAWIDRWEPEPRLALFFALLWGAAASVAIALIFSFAVQILEAIAGTSETPGLMLLTTVVQAPIVEETSKGVGILLLFWVFRRNFDGPVDGLVYGSMIAVGFAFTENIQYFGLALTSDNLSGVSEIFLLRGILSPFAHVMFTSCTGIVLGFASRRGTGAIGYFLLGLVPAVLLHAFWNGATLFVGDFYGYYFAVQVPLFLIAVGFVMYLRRQEQRITAARLAEYARVGWFTPGEVAQLSTSAGRRQTRAWANRFGLGREVARFTRNATKLAFARQCVISNRDRIGAQRTEAELLALLTADRAAIAALPPMPVQRAHS